MNRPTEPRKGPRKRALVVEDLDSLGHTICSLLQKLGYEVDRALDGVEALNMGRESHYDAVVCDLLMPRMGGRRLFETWLTENPDLAGRVVFVTGDNISAETRAFLARAGRPSIYKPFRLEQLADLIVGMDRGASILCKKEAS
ncbi:MAG: response regulator [Armatimonadetes bacterium]|nr:response regulator [Armatimonadota bacterium]